MVNLDFYFLFDIDETLLDGTIAKLFNLITVLIGVFGEKFLDILGYFIGDSSGNPIGVLLLTLILVGTAFMVLRRALSE